MSLKDVRTGLDEKEVVVGAGEYIEDGTDTGVGGTIIGDWNVT